MQELEVNPNINCDRLSLPGYFLETESNQTKIRTGIFVKSTLGYVRRYDLENSGLHLVIIDIKSVHKLRIINFYRPLNPPGDISAREFFNLQTIQIKQAYDNNTVLLGDFNLDWAKKIILQLFI
jgi:hypothetical protein